MISGIGDCGEGGNLDFENFLRDCACEPNVYVIALFDCCRRDKGRAGLFTNLSETYNIACIYRENMTKYVGLKCPCEPWDESWYMVKNFFEHLKNNQSDSQPGEVELRVLTDFASF